MSLNKLTFITLDIKGHLLGNGPLMSDISPSLAVGSEPHEKCAPPRGSDLHYRRGLRHIHRQLCHSLLFTLQTEVRGHSECNVLCVCLCCGTAGVNFLFLFCFLGNWRTSRVWCTAVWLWLCSSSSCSSSSPAPWPTLRPRVCVASSGACCTTCWSASSAGWLWKWFTPSGWCTWCLIRHQIHGPGTCWDSVR